jgi:hypothetical protein
VEKNGKWAFRTASAFIIALLAAGGRKRNRKKRDGFGKETRCSFRRFRQGSENCGSVTPDEITLSLFSSSRNNNRAALRGDIGFAAQAKGSRCLPPAALTMACSGSHLPESAAAVTDYFSGSGQNNPKEVRAWARLSAFLIVCISGTGNAHLTSMP